MARPKKPIDEEQVKRLAAIQCSHAEMAAVVGCSSDTLERRFAAAIKEGREQGRMSLKRKQYEMAMAGNVTMLIWLGKQHLEQRDKPAGEAEVVVNNFSAQSDDELKTKAKALAAEIIGEHGKVKGS